MYYKDLLRFRQAWLGLALLWIILFHLPIDLGLLDYPRAFGYGGVDICFFASGIGCFYSLSADPDIGNFMKRRLKRLLPTYLVFILVWLLYQYAAGDFALQMAIGNLFALQHFTGLGSEFNWYISALLLFYLLAPYFVVIIQRASPVQKLLFLLFLILCSVPFWGAEEFIITVTRLPIFYMGMIFADLCKKELRISRGHVPGLIAAFMLGLAFLVTTYFLFPAYLWSHGLHWYPFILITPPLCIGISSVLMLLEKSKAMKLFLSFFSLCGGYSFELYLVHILLVSCISDLISAFELSRFRYPIWAAGGVGLFVGCYLLRRCAVWADGLLQKTRGKRTSS